MENTSKALMIAGEILISVLILSLLVVGYTNLREYMYSKEELKNQGQHEDFNKQFYIYQQDLNGSTVLSLANKVVDYNIREAEDKGYQRIDVKITFFIDMYVKIGGKNYGFMAGKSYSTDKNQANNNNQKYIIDTINELIDKKNEYGDIVYTFTEKNYLGNYVDYKYTISKMANLRTNELQDLIKNKSENEQNKINKEIGYYNQLYTIERDVKSKIFKYTKSNYDSSTGRITYILYNCDED